jgi:hypothetical protein
VVPLALALVACSTAGAGGPASESARASGAAARSGSTYDTPLAGICPDTVVVQTNWYPQPDHGFAYQLIGDRGTIDTEKMTYTGPLGATGVQLEIRAGGPAIGFQQVSSILYQDRDILFGLIGTDEAIQHAKTAPTVGVFATYERNPQAWVWGDPSWSFSKTADIGAAGVPVLAYEGSAYLDVFVEKGLLKQDQIDTSFQGDPARFVAEQGRVVQQAFVTSEPYSYEHEVAQWQKPVKYLLVGDDFPVYQNALSIRADAVEGQRACLEKLIPLFQRAEADYVANPKPVNDLLVDYVSQLNGGFVLSAGKAADSSAKQLELGLISNGDDSTLGDFDASRVQRLVDDLQPVFRARKISLPDDLSPDDLVSNDFLDRSIGLVNR